MSFFIFFCKKIESDKKLIALQMRSRFDTCTHKLWLFLLRSSVPIKPKLIPRVDGACTRQLINLMHNLLLALDSNAQCSHYNILVRFTFNENGAGSAHRWVFGPRTCGRLNYLTCCCCSALWYTAESQRYSFDIFAIKVIHFALQSSWREMILSKITRVKIEEIVGVSVF